MQHWANGLTYAYELEIRGKQKWPNNMFHKNSYIIRYITVSVEHFQITPINTSLSINIDLIKLLRVTFGAQ